MPMKSVKVLGLVFLVCAGPFVSSNVNLGGFQLLGGLAVRIF